MVEYIWHEGPVPKNMRVTQVAGILFNDEGDKIIADYTLVAITLMIAESRAEEKEAMVSLIMNFLNW